MCIIYEGKKSSYTRRKTIMFPSTPLTRMRFAGKLCKRGAWVTAVLGLAFIVLFVISNISNNQGDPGSGPNFNQLVNILFPAFLIALPTLFFFLILYAAGTLLDYLSAEKKPQVLDDDERVEITSLSEMR
jgi:hypothetical protein